MLEDFLLTSYHSMLRVKDTRLASVHESKAQYPNKRSAVLLYCGCMLSSGYHFHRLRIRDTFLWQGSHLADSLSEGASSDKQTMAKYVEQE